MKLKSTSFLNYRTAVQNDNQNVRKFHSAFVLFFMFISNVYSQNIGINTTGAAPNSKALLDIDANNVSGEKKALLIPRMTTSERSTLSSTGSTPESLLIFNTTTHCFEAWNQSILAWVPVGCLNCQLPGASIAMAATRNCSSFTANWTASAIANGYYLDVSMNSTFTSFVTGFNNLSISNVLTYSVTGLAANTTYYYRVRAVNSCGTAVNSNTIAVTTDVCPSCNSSQVEADYGTVVTSLSGSSKTWITRNLGATAIASSATSTVNTEAGCYFQFNRAQAYGCDNGGTVNPVWTTTAISESSDWLIANDPCSLQLGGSWRIPTKTEWSNVTTNGPWANYANTYASILKMHAAGYLLNSNGLLDGRGLYLLYWSGNQSSTANGWCMYVDSSSLAVFGTNKSSGLSVRCIK